MRPNAPRCMCKAHRLRAVVIRFNMARFPAKSAWVTWRGENDAESVTLAGPFEEMSGAEDWIHAQPTDAECRQPYAPPGPWVAWARKSVARRMEPG